MAPCVPGCEAIESIGNITELAQSWDSGPIKVSFNLEVEITEEKAPELVTFVTRGEEGSRSSVVSAKSSLRLDALSAQQTEVRYSSDVNGRLGKRPTSSASNSASASAHVSSKLIRWRTFEDCYIFHDWGQSDDPATRNTHGAR